MAPVPPSGPRINRPQEHRPMRNVERPVTQLQSFVNTPRQIQDKPLPVPNRNAVGAQSKRLQRQPVRGHAQKPLPQRTSKPRRDKQKKRQSYCFRLFPLVTKQQQDVVEQLIPLKLGSAINRFSIDTVTTMASSKRSSSRHALSVYSRASMQAGRAGSNRGASFMSATSVYSRPETISSGYSRPASRLTLGGFILKPAGPQTQAPLPQRSPLQQSFAFGTMRPISTQSQNSVYSRPASKQSISFQLARPESKQNHSSIYARPPMNATDAYNYPSFRNYEEPDTFANRPTTQQTIGFMYTDPEPMGTHDASYSRPATQQTVGFVYNKPQSILGYDSTKSRPETQQTVGFVYKQPGEAPAPASRFSRVSTQHTVGLLFSDSKPITKNDNVYSQPSTQQTIGFLYPETQRAMRLSSQPSQRPPQPDLGTVSSDPYAAARSTQLQSSGLNGRQSIGSDAFEPPRSKYSRPVIQQDNNRLSTNAFITPRSIYARFSAQKEKNSRLSEMRTAPSVPSWYNRPASGQNVPFALQRDSTQSATSVYSQPDSNSIMDSYRNSTREDPFDDRSSFGNTDYRQSNPFEYENFSERPSSYQRMQHKSLHSQPKRQLNAGNHASLPLSKFAMPIISEQDIESRPTTPMSLRRLSPPTPAMSPESHISMALKRLSEPEPDYEPETSSVRSSFMSRRSLSLAPPLPIAPNPTRPRLSALPMIGELPAESRPLTPPTDSEWELELPVESEQTTEEALELPDVPAVPYHSNLKRLSEPFGPSQPVAMRNQRRSMYTKIGRLSTLPPLPQLPVPQPVSPIEMPEPTQEEDDFREISWRQRPLSAPRVSKLPPLVPPRSYRRSFSTHTKMNLGQAATKEEVPALPILQKPLRPVVQTPPRTPPEEVVTLDPKTLCLRGRYSECVNECTGVLEKVKDLVSVLVNSQEFPTVLTMDAVWCPTNISDLSRFLPGHIS